jgi:hypothetical protein
MFHCGPVDCLLGKVRSEHDVFRTMNFDTNFLKFINNSWVITPIPCKHSVTRRCVDTVVKHRQTQHHKSLAAYVIKIFDESH